MPSPPKNGLRSHKPFAGVLLCWAVTLMKTPLKSLVMPMFFSPL